MPNDGLAAITNAPTTNDGVLRVIAHRPPGDGVLRITIAAKSRPRGDSSASRNRAEVLADEPLGSYSPLIAASVGCAHKFARVRNRPPHDEGARRVIVARRPPNA
eukprot:TRINITY_DN33302_c0_g1_i1.p2 TRINITY_DN33302_c0_g1~~TRINITY_DN33302_c0_g1_i1.p2  ORF type:complete len:105 (-),score=6.26 TRINITY_DN33302_c0_g1_i1:145-459(-)